MSVEGREREREKKNDIPVQTKKFVQKFNELRANIIIAPVFNLTLLSGLMSMQIENKRKKKITHTHKLLCASEAGTGKRVDLLINKLPKCFQFVSNPTEVEENNNNQIMSAESSSYNHVINKKSMKLRRIEETHKWTHKICKEGQSVHLYNQTKSQPLKYTYI